MKVIVVGGGMAGMSAAQAWAERGHSVTLLEQYFCGSQASGKSSGFITTESELNVTHFSCLVGKEGARKIWDFGIKGCQFIENNIITNQLACDYRKQDSCVLANRSGDFELLSKEHDLRVGMGYKSTLVPRANLGSLIGSSEYFGGLIWHDTFGINAYQYVQEMKLVLLKRGVQVLEQTPVLQVKDHEVVTPKNTYTADVIIVCVDRFLPQLHMFAADIYQAQTFIALSKPLPDSVIKQLFPERQLMVWDTDLIYTYFRLVDGNRLLVGGSNYLSIFWGSEQPRNMRVRSQLSRYISRKFPYIDFQLEYFWPGLIGISKDLMPIAGSDPNNPHIYCISAAVGLPWAAALGRYSAEKILDGKTDFDQYFSPERKFTVPDWAQTIVGKRVAFAVSNWFVGMF